MSPDDSNLPDSKFEINSDGELIMQIPVRKEDYDSMKSKSKDASEPVHETHSNEGENEGEISDSDEGEHLSYDKGS